MNPSGLPLSDGADSSDGSHSPYGSDWADRGNSYSLPTNIFRILGLFYNIKTGNPLLLSKIKVIKNNKKKKEKKKQCSRL